MKRLFALALLATLTMGSGKGMEEAAEAVFGQEAPAHRVAAAGNEGCCARMCRKLKRALLPCLGVVAGAGTIVLMAVGYDDLERQIAALRAKQGLLRAGMFVAFGGIIFCVVKIGQACCCDADVADLSDGEDEFFW